jgi:hypothetical protein
MDSERCRFWVNASLNLDLPSISNIKLRSLQLVYYAVTFSQIKMMYYSLAAGHIITSRISIDWEIYYFHNQLQIARALPFLQYKQPINWILKCIFVIIIINWIFCAFHVLCDKMCAPI